VREPIPGDGSDVSLDFIVQGQLSFGLLSYGSDFQKSHCRAVREQRRGEWAHVYHLS
jgi:hypothetical protein